MANSPKRPARTAPSPKLPKRADARHAPKAKLDQMIDALRTAKGATITDLMKITGWQAHSVRGAMSGAFKKKRGLTITSAKKDGERVYRIAGRP